MKLTPKQAALVERLRGGRLLMTYMAPGREDIDAFGWYIESPYTDEDGRTCQSLLRRRLLKNEGDGMYILREGV